MVNRILMVSGTGTRRSRKCSFNIRVKNAEQCAGIPGMRRRRIESVFHRTTALKMPRRALLLNSIQTTNYALNVRFRSIGLRPQVEGPEPGRIPAPGLSGSLIKTVQLYGGSSEGRGYKAHRINNLVLHIISVGKVGALIDFDSVLSTKLTICTFHQ